MAELPLTRLPLAVIAGGKMTTGGPMTDLDDDDLMRLVSREDGAAFREIVRRHERGLRAYCGHSLGDGALGDDVAQEVFLDLWRGRTRYVGQGKLGSYLYAVARHRCEDARRRIGKRPRSAAPPAERPALPGAVSGPEDEGPAASRDDLLAEVIRAERLARLEAALAATSPKLREAILLRFSAGLSYADIARVTGRSEVTIRSRVLLGIRKLRDLLDSKGEEP